MISISPNYIYYLTIVLFFTITIYVFRKKENVSDKIFIFWLLTFFFLSKIPYFFQNYSIGIDEGLMLAQSISLKNGLIFWSDVDFTTSGPLNSLILIPISFILGKFDYTSCRIAFFLLVSISLIFTYLTVTKIFTKTLARILIFLIVLFFLGTTHYDFRHYSSELLSVALLSISVFLTVRENIQYSKYSLVLIFINGLFLGMLPFAKLQSVPPAFAIFVYFNYLIFIQEKIHFNKLVWFFAGCFTFPLIMLIYVLHYDIFNIVKYLYIDENLKYGSKEFFLYRIWRFINWFKLDALKIHLYFSLFCLFLTFFTNTFKKIFVNILKVKHFNIFIFFYLFMAVFAITRSGYPAEHYFYYYIFWSCFVNAVFLIQIFKTDKHIYLVNKIILIVSILSIAFLNLRIENNPKIENSATIKLINDVKKDNESIVVWGWNFDYYIKTESSQGCLENHIARFFMWSHSNPKMVKLYIESLHKHKPVIIIDGITSYSFVRDRIRHGLQLFPQIQNYIKANYTAYKTIEENTLYLRNDRYLELKNNTKRL
jgi:hypothetical protein